MGHRQCLVMITGLGILLAVGTSTAFGQVGNGITTTVATTPAPTFTNDNLTSATVNITSTKDGTPVAAGTVVDLNYEDGNGNSLGSATAAVGANGSVVIQPPANAQGPGNKVQIVDPTHLNLGQPSTSLPLIWYQSGWIWKTDVFKVDPLGIPGITANQNWYIADSGVTLSGAMPNGGAFDATVLASNFDLSYTSLGHGAYSATISGTDSFIELSNQTIIGLQSGTDFGTIQNLTDTGTTATGTFDFSAIGLSGSYSWDSTSDYTDGITSTTGDWTGNAISVQSVPEPSSLVLLGLGAALGLAARVRHSRTSSRARAT